MKKVLIAGFTWVAVMFGGVAVAGGIGGGGGGIGGIGDTLSTQHVEAKASWPKLIIHDTDYMGTEGDQIKIFETLGGIFSFNSYSNDGQTLLDTGFQASTMFGQFDAWNFKGTMAVNGTISSTANIYATGGTVSSSAIDSTTISGVNIAATGTMTAGGNNVITTSSGTQTIAGVKTFTSDPKIENTTPQLVLKDTDSAASTANPSVRFNDNTGSQMGLIGYTSGDGVLTIAQSLSNENILLYTNGGDVTLNNSLVSSKACAANYTRVSANYCMRDRNAGSNTALTRSVCTDITKPASDATGLVMRFYLRVGANNAVGARYANINGWTGAGCSGAMNMVLAQADAREQVATAAGTLLASRFQTEETDDVLSIVYSDDSSQGAGYYWIAGYYD